MPREDSLGIAGCRVFLRRAGKGPPLLVLHNERGGGWSPALARLARRFDVIAPDLPGFGSSETPEWFENIHDLAYFTQALIETLDLDGVHLLGQGIGGWVAAEAALRNASRLASLTLVAASGLHVKGIATVDPFLATPEEEVRASVHDPALADRLWAEAQTPEAIERQLKNRFAFARLAWAPRLHDPHLEKWLHRIALPTLVLWGKEDRLLPPAFGTRWAERIPGARLHLLPRCGHLPEIEQPEAFCDAVEAFIAGSAS
jgi:pimeloyl-ACP methyl ester carboxylesterase